MAEHKHEWEADLDKNQDPIVRRRLGLEMASFHCKHCDARTWMTDHQFDTWWIQFEKQSNAQKEG